MFSQHCSNDTHLRKKNKQTPTTPTIAIQFQIQCGKNEVNDVGRGWLFGTHYTDKLFTLRNVIPMKLIHYDSQKY